MLPLQGRNISFTFNFCIAGHKWKFVAAVDRRYNEQFVPASLNFSVTILLNCNGVKTLYYEP